MASIMDLMNNVQAGFERGRARGQASSLAKLSGDYAAGGAPDYQGIARNGGNPLAFRNDMQGQEDRKREQLGQMASLIARVPKEYRPALYKQNYAQISQFVPNAPPEYNDQVDGLVEAMAAQFGNRTQQDQLPAEARTALFFQQHPELIAQEQERYKNRPFYNPNDNTLIYPKGMQTGSPSAPPQGQPAPNPAGSSDAVTAAMNYMIQNGVPQDKVEAWGMQQLNGSQAPAPSGGQSVRPAGPGIVQMGPGAADRAAQVTTAQEQAKIDTQVGNAPRVAGAEATVAAAKAGAEADAKARSERANTKAQSKVDQDNALAVYEAAIGGLKDSLESTPTGPIIGRAPALTSGQQIADGGVAAIAPVLKQLFRSAGEGVFTDKDQELLIRMIPTRTDTPAARKFKLDNIDRIVRAKLRNATKAPASNTDARRALLDKY